MAREIVKLREKKLKNGGSSLYLDINWNGHRSFEFLGLYLQPGNDPITKAKNNSALEAGKIIQARRLIEIQENTSGIVSIDKRSMTIKSFTEDYLKTKRCSQAYKDAMIYAISHWCNYAGEESRFKNVTAQDLRKYLDYLYTVPDGHHNRIVKFTTHAQARTADEIMAEIKRLTSLGKSQRVIAKELGIGRRTVEVMQKKKNVATLSDKTVHHYFFTLHTIFKAALREGIISSNPFDRISPSDKPKVKETERQFLTIEELKKLIATPNKYSVVRRMFLFGCFTGLRFSDICRITWADIDRKIVTIAQEKTDRIVSVPLSHNALEVLPPRGKEPTVFNDIPRLSVINKELKRWVASAEINKKISFHCSRHTFATLLLSNDVDIYTVSKLLGHTNIQTTQIYAKVIDKKKEEAVNAIPTLNLK